MRRTQHNPDMGAEQSSDLQPRDKSASQPVQHSLCRWSVQTLLMCAMRSKSDDLSNVEFRAEAP